MDKASTGRVVRLWGHITIGAFQWRRAGPVAKEEASDWVRGMVAGLREGGRRG